MLLGLLSGIRDFRSPLIVGYVIVVALWLLLYHLFPEGASGVHRDYPEIAHLATVIGSVGIAAAVSFVAYLLGDLVVRESSRALLIRGQPPIEASPNALRQGLRRVFSLTHDAEIDELEARLSDLVDRTVREGGADNLDYLTEQLAQRISTTPGRNLSGFRIRRDPTIRSPQKLSLAEQVRVEAKSGRIDERILAEKPELYSELYRLRSEAEFRAGLLPSLALLALAVAVRVPWPWWLLLVLGIAFLVFEWLMLGEIFQLRTRARAIAERAVVDELVTTPTLDAIRRETKRVGPGTPEPGITDDGDGRVLERPQPHTRSSSDP
jgi:hypothetical protein